MLTKKPEASIRLPDVSFFHKAVGLRSKGFDSLLKMYPVEKCDDIEPALAFKFKSTSREPVDHLKEASSIYQVRIPIRIQAKTNDDESRSPHTLFGGLS